MNTGFRVWEQLEANDSDRAGRFSLGLGHLIAHSLEIFKIFHASATGYQAEVQGNKITSTSLY